MVFRKIATTEEIDLFIFLQSYDLQSNSSQLFHRENTRAIMAQPHHLATEYFIDFYDVSVLGLHYYFAFKCKVGKTRI